MKFKQGDKVRIVGSFCVPDEYIVKCSYQPINNDVPLLVKIDGNGIIMFIDESRLELVPIKPMNFLEACNKMREGKKVRREGWAAGSFAECNSFFVEIQHDTKKYSLNITDYQANDWYVV